MTFSSLLSIRSHPMRVRGLKLEQTPNTQLVADVAPHAGAWIETDKALTGIGAGVSHPMRVRGLKRNQ